MKITNLVAALVASSLLAAACSSTGGKNSSGDKEAGSAANLQNTVAVVNGKPISKNALNSLIAEITKQNPDQTVSEDKAVELLVNRELLRQDAEKLGLDKGAAVEGRLENATRDVLAQADVDNFRRGIAVTDEQARKEYDSKIAVADFVEFKARHILLETESEANDVVASLKKGAKFEEVAKKLSKDPAAKQNGGEVGWFNPAQMIPEFSNAVASLKNGEISAPVKTKAGWHVIQREDSRKKEPPPFDTVKEQIRTVLINQKLQQHVEELKKTAKIENLVAGKK